MKILLATEGDSQESKIDKRFGDAPYYLIYDSEAKETEVRVNPGHDDNHSALIDLVNEDVLHYIAGNTGPNAFELLIKQFIEEKFKIPVIVGTHPIPQKYWLTHQKLKTWNPKNGRNSFHLLFVTNKPDFGMIEHKNQIMTIKWN